MVAKTFSDYIARRNTTLMYRLQWQVWLLSFIAALAAIGSIVTNWSQLRQAVATMLKH
jgi:hypothetical protein